MRYCNVLLICFSHGFDAILPVGKAVRNYSVCMGIGWQITFLNIDFAQLMNCNLTILGGRL